MIGAIDRVAPFVLLLVVGLLMATCAAGVATADPQPDPIPTSSAPVADRDTALDRPAEDIAEDTYDAVRSGHWLVALGLALMLAVKGAREIGGWAGGRWAWLQTDRGGATTALVLAGMLEVALLLASGRSPSFSGIVGALGAAFVAAGGRNLVARLFKPRDKPAVT